MSERDLYRRAKDLFAELFELDEEERQRQLDGLQTDPALRAMVEELLEVHDQENSPIRTGSGQVIPPAPGSAPIPDTIGSYRVIRRLGAGAMGVVFEAEQDKPRRRVALKVVRPGLWSDEIVRRFEQESALLARLHHPGIAQVYEVGQYDGGDGPQSFFALEFVDGSDLRHFTRERELDLPAKIGLLLQICAAVQHAHDRGVIHRDLKPDNIVVGKEGHLKVLDFGIARALDQNQENTTLTSHGQVLGTLPYMSPEQIAGAKVEARSDLYSLGVIAYELLAGERPLDVDGLPLTKAAQIITEREPPRLGTRIPEARGDLETIVATALQKEPERRYASASDLADDFERYLRHEPIRARPTSALYQLRKFARRHRTAVAGLAIAILAMAVAIPVITVSLIRSQSAAARSASVNHWLTSVLSSVHPTSAGAETRLIDALDIAASEVESRFGEDPEQEILVRKLLAEMYSAQSMDGKSLGQIDRAIELCKQWRDDHPEQLALEVLRIVCLVRLDGFDAINRESEPLLERLLAKHGPDHEDVLTIRRIRATMVHRTGEFGAAADLLREVLADATALFGKDHPTYTDCVSSLANTLLALGRRSKDPDVASRSLEECIELATPLTVPDRDAIPTIRESLLAIIVGDANLELGRPAPAEALARQVIDQTEGRYAENHTTRLHAFQLLAGALEAQRRLSEASDWAIRALDGYLESENPSSSLAMGVAVTTQSLLLRAERYADAERYARQSLDDLPDSPIRSWLSLNHRSVLACCLVATGRHDEGSPLVDELFAVYEDDGLRKVDRRNRAPFLFACFQDFDRRGDTVRAERAGLDAHEIAVTAELSPALRERIRSGLAEFYSRHDRDDDAARWRD